MRSRTPGLLLMLASCALCLSFLYPLAGQLPGGRERVVVPPRGKGDGVVYRQVGYRGARVDLLDVDLDTPGVSVRVQARRAVPGGGGWSVGDAFTLPVWCRLTGAVGGVNGGFFGEEIEPGRKEVIGLLQTEGRVRAPAALYRSRSDRRITYAHSAFGVAADGRPLIGWIVSKRGRPQRLLCYPRPERLRAGRPWPSRSALAGGPRLIHRGRIAVADREERLVSPGPQARTFVGYAVRGRAARLVLATATAFTYEDAAQFLQEYFRRTHGTRCEEAMCLDGGTSSQMAYRCGGRVCAVPAASVSVPACILIYDDRKKER